MDAGLNTWNSYDSVTHFQVGRLNVHGYSNGTEPYHGPNRTELRRAAADQPRWLSEYGDGDASGYWLAQEIIRDVKELQPNGWVYVQPVEPDVHDFGWGLINANYVDTHDRPVANRPRSSARPASFSCSDNSRAMSDRDLTSLRLLIQTRLPLTRAVCADFPSLRLLAMLLSQPYLTYQTYLRLPTRSRLTATTTAPGGRVPDWKQRNQLLRVSQHGGRKLIETNLYPKSVYTFVVQGVLR